MLNFSGNPTPEDLDLAASLLIKQQLPQAIELIPAPSQLNNWCFNAAEEQFSGHLVTAEGDRMAWQLKRGATGWEPSAKPLEFAELSDRLLSAAELNQTAPSVLRYLLQHGEKGYKDGIDEIRSWRWNEAEQAFEGVFVDRRPGADRAFSFTIANRGGEWLRSFQMQAESGRSNFAEDDLLTNSEWDAIANAAGSDPSIAEAMAALDRAAETLEDVEFAEPADPLSGLDAQGQRDLIDVLNEVYQDGVERVVGAKLDTAGDIRVVFEDVNGAIVRRFAGKIEDPDGEPIVTFKLASEGAASFSEHDFAPKKSTGAAKKKNCTPGKSISCGASCISLKKTCRSTQPVSDKAKGKARSAKAKLSGDAPTPKPDQPSKDTIPDLESAKQQYRSLGSGIDGEVFLDTSTDPPRALKYRSNQTAPEYERDVLDNLKMAGELGISPRLLGEYPDRKAFAMEFLEGFTPGIHPRSDDDDDFSVANDKDLLPYDRAFLRTLKVAHDNNLVVDDLHADNVMVNGTTGQTRFIDQGGIKRGTNEEIADQLLNRYSWRPLVAETIDRMSGSALNATAKRELRAIQRSWNNRDEKPLSEAEYGQMISRVYALLGVD